MANTKVELNYFYRKEESYAWQHRKLGERVEIKEEEIAEIAKRSSVVINVSIKESKIPGFLLPILWERRPGQFILKGRETIVTILGNEESQVRDCLITLLKTYGVPDAVSKGRWGEKNKAEKMVQSVLEELGFSSFGLV
jgi:hypothetical protein